MTRLKSNKFLKLSALLLSSLALQFSVHAQSNAQTTPFPTKPIKLIVPHAVGGLSLIHI